MGPNERGETCDMGFLSTLPTCIHSFPGDRECSRATGEQCWGFQGSARREGKHQREEDDDGDMKQGEVDEGSSHEGGGQNQKLCARGHWRPAEDAKLKELVSQFGPQNWNMIAEKLEGRSGKSCRLRWFNQLDPRINRRAFKEEEEERLLAAHRLYGNKWALIARFFPGRTDNAVKNHWHMIMARKQREQSNAFRRRRPSAQQRITRRRSEVNDSINVRSGESTITSTRDESAFTCTDLSLHSFNNNALPNYLSRYIAQYQARHPYDVFSGPNRRMATAGNNFYDKHNDSGSFTHVAPMMLIPGFEQSAFSYTSSNASATEPSLHGVTNDNWAHDGADHSKGMMTLSFIDFLGVGAN